MFARAWASFWKTEGVEPVARTGDSFQPADHEAVGEAVPKSEESGGTIAEVVQQGADAVCYKPFDVPALLAKLRELAAAPEEGDGHPPH